MRHALLPLLFIIIVVFYHRFVKIACQHDSMCPSVCVISGLSVCFSSAKTDCPQKPETERGPERSVRAESTHKGIN